MKILLFGSGGQLGLELKPALEKMGEVLALTRESRDFCGDLGNPDGIGHTVKACQADVIINAAAWTDVDGAEVAAHEAHMVNTLAPRAMAMAAALRNAWMISFSTDYVFSGSGDRAWKESDAAQPLNVYGKTKLEGEFLVARHCPMHLILRTSWLHSPRGRNFVKTVLACAQELRGFDVVDDQMGAPTEARWLADVTVGALARAMAQPKLGGLYHVAAGGVTSRHGVASFAIECAQKYGMNLSLAPGSIKAVSSLHCATAARRPLNSRLDTSKFRAAFDIVLPHWQLGVERTVAALS